MRDIVVWAQQFDTLNFTKSSRIGPGIDQDEARKDSKKPTVRLAGRANHEVSKPRFIV